MKVGCNPIEHIELYNKRSSLSAVEERYVVHTNWNLSCTRNNHKQRTFINKKKPTQKMGRLFLSTYKYVYLIKFKGLVITLPSDTILMKYEPALNSEISITSRLDAFSICLTTLPDMLNT